MSACRGKAGMRFSAGIRPVRLRKSTEGHGQLEKFRQPVKTFTGWTAQIFQRGIDCRGGTIT